MDKHTELSAKFAAIVEELRTLAARAYGIESAEELHESGSQPRTAGCPIADGLRGGHAGGVLYRGGLVMTARLYRDLWDFPFEREGDE